MTLLVPTDFSKASKTAVLFAINLARKLGGEVQILHVVQANPSGETLMKWKKLEEEMIRMAQEDGDALMAEINTTIRGKKPPVSFHIRQGYDFTIIVNHVAEEIDADLIVMGTTGASGLKKALLGSHAAAMMSTATLPVLAVPAESKYSRIAKMVYATDLKHTEDEIKTVAMFAQLIGARVEVLHVVKQKTKALPDPKIFSKTLQDIAQYKKITFHVVKGEKVANAVDSFVKKQKAQLLTTFTHKLDFFEKLFGKGITRKLAYHIRVPILTFNKTTLR